MKQARTMQTQTRKTGEPKVI